LKKIRLLGTTKTGEAPLVFLVGTHMDEFGNLSSLEQSRIQDEIYKFIGNPTLARTFPQLGERIFYISAFSGAGMRDLNAALRQTIKDYQKQEKKKIPSSWVRFGEYLNELRGLQAKT
jgi:hypothetical protein